MIQQLPHAFSTPRCSASAERPPACRACVRITIHSAHWNPPHQQFLGHAFFYLTYLRLYDDTLYIVPLARSFILHGSFTASAERPPACRACVRITIHSAHWNPLHHQFLDLFTSRINAVSTVAIRICHTFNSACNSSL